MKKLSEKLLMVVAIKYGKDSAEYEMAGGVCSGDRLRKIRSTRLKNIAEQASDKNGKLPLAQLQAIYSLQLSQRRFS